MSLQPLPKNIYSFIEIIIPHCTSSPDPRLTQHIPPSHHGRPVTLIEIPPCLEHSTTQTPRIEATSTSRGVFQLTSGVKRLRYNGTKGMTVKWFRAPILTYILSFSIFWLR